ncbi:MAG: ABC transporter ATP-binding protein [Proteobacteria bacterium]|nr:ABC transporter ATP-binding protein [Pseudomonadota bacterium]
MGRVDLEHISKRYLDVAALEDVSLVIASGEFFTLLGPSGCGKTTLLRTVAGFSRQDSGRIVIDGESMDDVPTHRRDIGMVFQDYAIFPHMTVAANVAFGLKTRRRPRPEIAERVARALDLVQLGSQAERLPHQLSGGQQQRVALARALVINPKILLMDEPLSNLDAKLRLELRDDIRDLQRRLGITTLYVTHDQEEALAISDRICVMQAGRIHQLGSPEEIYAKPQSLFVAAFVGAMNVLPEAELDMGEGGPLNALPRLRSQLGEQRRVTLAIRPEDVILRETAENGVPEAGIGLVGQIDKVTFAGREAIYRVICSAGQSMLVQVSRPDRRQLALSGADVHLRLPEDRLHVFDAADGSRIDVPS